MEINLKSNRRFILVISGIYIFVLTSFLVLTIIFAVMEPFDIAETIIVLTIILLLDCLSILVYLIAKYHQGSSFTFTKEKILTFEKGVFFQEISVSEIESMHYYPFRWHYIVFGALPEVGAMKVHLKAYDGRTCEIGFIGESDAYRIKELYPDKFTIYYERKKKKQSLADINRNSISCDSKGER